MDPLSSLRAAFQAHLADDLKVLQAAQAAHPTQDAIYAVHRIASIAGVLGHIELGELAVAMDEHARETGGFAENDLSALIEDLSGLL